MKQLKVAKVIEEGHIGGPQVDILRTSKLIEKDGISATIILPVKDSLDFQKQLDKADIDFRTSPMCTLRKNFISIILYIFRFVYELLVLVTTLKKLKPDIVHVCGGSWQVKGVLAGRLIGAKVIWHLNDTNQPGIIFITFQLLKPLAHGFIAAGSRVKNYYLNDEKKKPISIILQPVNFAHFNPSIFSSKEVGKTKNILTLANISPVKGLVYFFQMASLLNKKFNQSTEFRIVGAVYKSQKKYKSLLDHLKKDLGLENIKFVGKVDDVRQELHQSDIFVCTSLLESGPMTVWEAMAMAKPVVTTDVGEVSNIIEHEVSGLIVPPGNAEVLASQVMKLLQNPEHAHQMGKNARQQAFNQLDVKFIAKQHSKAYREIME